MHPVKKLSRHGTAFGRESYTISQYTSLLYTWEETFPFSSFSDSISVPCLIDTSITVNSEQVVN